MKLPPAPRNGIRFRSLSARRVWIEIPIPLSFSRDRDGHSPRGGCGLKSEPERICPAFCGSLSARRVWIEILPVSSVLQLLSSLSARRVWIEIMLVNIHLTALSVTLREEGVD